GALAACPATLPDPCATGAQCQAAGGGLCDCQCGPACGSSGHYTCGEAHDACPAAFPNLGAACCPEALGCVYRCGKGGARMCKSGQWATADGGICPVSVRSAKRAIRYL